MVARLCALAVVSNTRGTFEKEKGNEVQQVDGMVVVCWTRKVGMAGLVSAGPRCRYRQFCVSLLALRVLPDGSISLRLWAFFHNVVVLVR